MERVRELLRREDGGGARALGGLLLGIGVLVVLFRRTGLDDPWGSLPVFLILFLTAVFLYGFGFWGARLRVRPLGWQTIFVVFGVLLIPFAAFAFIDWVGGNTNAPLNNAWVFLLTAVAAFAAALLAGVRVGCLLGGLALIVAWLALWSELLDNGLADIGTVRGLLVLIALILLVVAALVAIRGRPEGGGSDLITAAGVAAVLAGAISIGALASPFFFAAPAVGTNLFWDIELFVAALALLLYGAVSGARGPTYVGALGLVAFVYVVGFDLDDKTPEGSLLGWPLILLLAAAGLLVASVVPALRRTGD